MLTQINRIILVLLISHTLAGCGEDLKHWPTTRFDQAEWTQSDEKERFVFVRDLIKSKKLDGFTKQQVLDLLGKPSCDNIHGEYITYIVKADSGIVSMLDIRFYNNREHKIVGKILVRSD